MKCHIAATLSLARRLEIPTPRGMLLRVRVGRVVCASLCANDPPGLGRGGRQTCFSCSSGVKCPLLTPTCFSSAILCARRFEKLFGEFHTISDRSVAQPDSVVCGLRVSQLCFSFCPGSASDLTPVLFSPRPVPCDPPPWPLFCQSIHCSALASTRLVDALVAVEHHGSRFCAR